MNQDESSGFSVLKFLLSLSVFSFVFCYASLLNSVMMLQMKDGEDDDDFFEAIRRLKLQLPRVSSLPLSVIFFSVIKTPHFCCDYFLYY